MLYLAQSYKNSKFLKNLNFNYSRKINKTLQSEFKIKKFISDYTFF